MQRVIFVAVMACVVRIVCCCVAEADEGPRTGTQAEEAVDWFPRSPLVWERLTGNWGGARTFLEDQGLGMESSYVADTFANVHGGERRGAEYRGLMQFALTLDTAKASLWPGGKAQALFQNLHGRSVSEAHVGDVQLVSGIDDSKNRTQLSECWYEQTLAGERLRVKAGKQDANADFCASDHCTDFVNSSFGLIPTVPMPAYPDPGLGIALHFSPVTWLSLGGGCFDGEPHGGMSGFGSTFDGSQGYFYLLELNLKPQMKAGDHRLPGEYRFGGWYHSGRFEELTRTGDGGTVSHSYGAYLLLSQLVWKEKSGDDDAQGVGVFFQFGWAPPDRSEISRYCGGGVTWRGLLPGRDEDSVGLGAASAHFSHRTARTFADETTIECFYKVQLTPWMFVQPDFQYVVHPGGVYDNAAVVGGRVELTF